MDPAQRHSNGTPFSLLSFVPGSHSRHASPTHSSPQQRFNHGTDGSTNFISSPPIPSGDPHLQELLHPASLRAAVQPTSSRATDIQNLMNSQTSSTSLATIYTILAAYLGRDINQPDTGEQLAPLIYLSRFPVSMSYIMEVSQEPTDSGSTKKIIHRLKIESDGANAQIIRMCEGRDADQHLDITRLDKEMKKLEKNKSFQGIKDLSTKRTRDDFADSEIDRKLCSLTSEEMNELIDALEKLLSLKRQKIKLLQSLHSVPARSQEERNTENDASRLTCPITG